MTFNTDFINTYRLSRGAYVVSVKTSKTRWKRIRSCYSRYVNKKPTSRFPKKSYYLSHHLQFLRDFTQTREMINLARASKTASSSNPISDIVDTSNTSNEDVVEEIENVKKELNESRNDSEEVDDLNPNEDVMSPTTSQLMNLLKRPLNDTDQSAEGCSKAKAQKVNDVKKPEYDEKHAMELFLMSLLPRIIVMSEEKQSEFQVGILNLLHTLKFNNDL